MIKRFILFLFLGLLTALIKVSDLYLVGIELSNITNTFLALTVTYGLFQIVIRGFIDKKVPERKAKFLFRRLNNTVFYLIFLLWTLTAWVENAETLLLSYGLISAAVALALQDIFRNIIGGLALLVSRNYHVGDRVEIDGLVGDVIQIGLLYTTVMEVRNWVDGDQPTGRLSLVPNSKVVNDIVHNYTKDHKFIWDEIVIPVTYKSDWKKASTIIKNVLKEKQVEIDDRVKGQIERLSEKYFLEEKPTDPNIFVKITDNWVELHARYITNTLNRRVTKGDLSREILENIEQNKDIEIASQTVRVYQGGK